MGNGAEREDKRRSLRDRDGVRKRERGREGRRAILDMTAVTGVPKFALRWRLERMYGNCMQLVFLSKSL